LRWIFQDTFHVLQLNKTNRTLKEQSSARFPGWSINQAIHQQQPFSDKRVSRLLHHTYPTGTLPASDVLSSSHKSRSCRDPPSPYLNPRCITHRTFTHSRTTNNTLQFFACTITPWISWIEEVSPKVGSWNVRQHAPNCSASAIPIQSLGSHLLWLQRRWQWCQLWVMWFVMCVHALMGQPIVSRLLFLLLGPLLCT
jgi:hypothetical protein